MRSWSTTLLLVATVAAFGCKVRQPTSQVREAFDAANRPQLFGATTMMFAELTDPKAMSGFLPVKPWQDSYWPLYKKNLASRYAATAAGTWSGTAGTPATTTAATFAAMNDQLADLTTAPQSPLLSPAEKYDLFMEDGNFSLTKESWDQYDGQVAAHVTQADPTGLTPDPDDWISATDHSKGLNQRPSWWWAGICHGWSPAAVSEQAPGSAVLATNAKGRQVLFFEGDMRGLMSKAYATNAPGSFEQIGGICRSRPADVKTDKAGRPVDAALAASGQNLYIVENHWQDFGFVKVTTDMASPNTFVIASAGVTHDANNKLVPVTDSGSGAFGSNEGIDGSFDVWVYDDYKKFYADWVTTFQTFTTTQLGTNATAPVAGQPARDKVTFFKSCRDVNSGAFHLILAQSLSNASTNKQGFVFERERTYQIWNQPVYGFMSHLLVDTPIAKDESEYRPFRAKCTQHVAEFETRVAWISEPGPAQMAYNDVNSINPSDLTWENLDPSPGKDGVSPVQKVFQKKLAVNRYLYTVEFGPSDPSCKGSDDVVLGGEWWEHYYTDVREIYNTPDYIWKVGGITDALPSGGASPILYSFAKQLRDCSQGTAVPVNYWVGGQQVNAVSCNCAVGSQGWACTPQAPSGAAAGGAAASP